MTVNCPEQNLLRETIMEDLSLRQSAHPGVDCQKVFCYGGFVGSTIECHTTLPRAMDHARAHITQVEASGGSVANGRVILADTMTRSKGRFTRAWYAPTGGVWGCLIHANSLLDVSKRFVPLAVGLACCEAVQAIGGDGATIRWVNDVLFGEKKVAGFLVEGFSGPSYGEEYHLVGFGINLNNRTFPPELSGLATSLVDELGYELDISNFTALFLAKLVWNFGLLYYEEAEGLENEKYSGKEGGHLLLDNFRKLSDTVGQHVRFGFDVMTSPQYDATAIGIEPDGGLKMRFPDGSIKVEHSGEIRYL